jgi:hypothetical protein
MLALLGASGFRKFALAASAAWVLLICYGFGVQARQRVPSEIIAKFQITQIQTENLRRFIKSGALESGALADLQNKPFMHIPYPSAERLAALASDPTIRTILPSSLTEAPVSPTLMLQAKKFILHRGFLLLPLGIAGLLTSLLLFCPNVRAP